DYSCSSYTSNSTWVF
nr:immunoglobulin light chain junction region [Macaca mulatta]